MCGRFRGPNFPEGKWRKVLNFVFYDTFIVYNLLYTLFLDIQSLDSRASDHMIMMTYQTPIAPLIKIPQYLPASQQCWIGSNVRPGILMFMTVPVG